MTTKTKTLHVELFADPKKVYFRQSWPNAWREMYVALLLQFVNPKRDRLARHTWNIIDCMRSPDPFWELLANRYLGIDNPRYAGPETRAYVQAVNGIVWR